MIDNEGPVTTIRSWVGEPDMADNQHLPETRCEPPVPADGGVSSSPPVIDPAVPNTLATFMSSTGGSSAASDIGSVSRAALSGTNLRASASIGFAGRHEVLGQIGKGGMGVVLRGRDPDLKRELAIKVLRDRQKGNVEAVRRFIEEAQITGQLQHPGVVPVHEFGQFPDGRPFFTMKLVKGHTLAELLAARSSPADNLPHFLTIFLNICQPLAYAHARNVVHRDLKPANIMVGAFGEVQVMDWGLAKVLQPPASRPVPAKDSTISSVIWTARAHSDSKDSDSRDGSVIGTPAYMPPEQAQGRVDLIDERSDVFGLGAILCEILTGRPPYGGETGNDILRSAAEGKLGEAQAALDQCGADRELIALARDCLALNPEKRPGDAGIVVTRVRAHLEGAQERLHAAENERAAAEAKAAAERKARRITLGLAAAVVLAVVLGGGAATWLRHRYLAEVAETDRRQEIRELAVNNDLREAAEFRAAGRWNDAQAALRRAEGRLVGRAPESLQKRVAQLRVDLDMALRLEQARLQKSEANEDGEFDYERANRNYAKAFQAYGLDVLTLDQQTAADRINASGIKDLLNDAIGDWALSVHHDDKRRAQLVSLARVTDKDEILQRLWDAIQHDDQRALERLAARPEVADLSPADLRLLGEALDASRTSPVTLAFLRRAQQRHPADFWINLTLATRLSATGSASNLDEAVRYHSITIALRPDSPVPYYNLGRVLTAQRKFAEAEAIYREALRRRPNDALSHARLARVLISQGKFEAAVAVYRRCHELGSQDPSWTYPSARWLREAERMPALETKLPAILRGEAQPADNEERLVFARMCLRVKDMPAAAVRFFSAAIESQPELVNDPRGFYLSQAAIAAVLAASGHGKDAGMLPAGDRDRLRQQAQTWMRLDLRTMRKCCDDSSSADRRMVARRLRYWQSNPEFACVRDDESLAQLSDAERNAWQQIWSEVAALLQHAQKK